MTAEILWLSKKTTKADHRNTTNKIVYLDLLVSIDDRQDVEELPLVFMYALDLDIKEGIRVHVNASNLQKVRCQASLVRFLGRYPFTLELFVIGKLG
jgi:transcriptional antiterminator Rof (Rho-off)